MKRVIRDLVDTLLAMVMVCAFVTPILMLISYDIDKARKTNAGRPTIEMRDCGCDCVNTTTSSSTYEDIEREDTLSIYTHNNK